MFWFLLVLLLKGKLRLYSNKPDYGYSLDKVLK